VKKRVSISNHLEALECNTNPPLELIILFKKEFKRTKGTEEKIKAKVEEYTEKDNRLKENYQNK